LVYYPTWRAGGLWTGHNPDSNCKLPEYKSKALQLHHHSDFNFALGDMIPVKMEVMTSSGDPEQPQKLLLHLQ
jgi:hypothetical protein